MYNYETYKTADSRKSDVKYAGTSEQDIVRLDNSRTQTLSHAQTEKRTNFGDQ
ncbi:protocadherin beta-16-like, partial [Clarias magur]